jgi:hypothetical protein
MEEVEVNPKPLTSNAARIAVARCFHLVVDENDEIVRLIRKRIRTVANTVL